MTHRATNTKQVFMMPICPITMLEGSLDRLLAAFITDGPRKDEPNPAAVKLMERIIKIKVLLLVPTALTVTIPTINAKPAVKEALTANS